MLEIPQFASAQQHVGQALDDDRILPDAVAHIGQHLRRIGQVHPVQFGEGGVVHQHALAAVEQHDGFAHGLQHRRGAAVGAQHVALGIQAPADLPLQQPDHQAQQQQLHHQRTPADHRGDHATLFGVGGALAQQFVLASLQFGDQAAHRIVGGHVLDQRADPVRIARLRDPLGDQAAPFQRALQAADADLLVGVVAGEFGQVGRWTAATTRARP